MYMELTIDSSCNEAACTLAVTGEIDVSNADTFREALNKLIAPDRKAVIVDMTKVPYIDSTGIGVLMGATHRAEEENVKLTVVCPHENILRVLSMLGVDQQLDIRKEL